MKKKESIKPTHDNSPEWARVLLQERRGDMDHFKYDDTPSVLQKTKTSEGTSLADRELKNLVEADVWRNHSETVKQMNSNNRRNK